ncbi:MAG: XRE family transcriptional regulator [Treponemataceae bacterium]|nr:XRE family transcriptional regulator [Treponemataceae bacterium]
MTSSQNPERNPEAVPVKQRLQIRFGEKLRTVRESKGYTLKTVAKAAGVSESLVSQIERNHVSPAIDTLLALAEVLDINLEFLFEEYRRERPVHIIRAGERPAIQEDDVVYEQLARPEESDRANLLESYVIRIPAGSRTHRGSYGHLGREFGVISRGSARLKYESNEYILHEGDSVSFPAGCPHILENIGTVPLEAIWVVTPPQRFVGRGL